MRPVWLAIVLLLWGRVVPGGERLVTPGEVIPETSPAPPASGSLDPAALEGIRASTTSAFAVEIIDLFLRDAPGRVEALRLAAEAGDAASLDRVAHGLRGSAGMIGVVRIAELCSRIEALVEDGHVPEAVLVVERLPAEVPARAPGPRCGAPPHRRPGGRVPARRLTRLVPRRYVVGMEVAAR